MLSANSRSVSKFRYGITGFNSQAAEPFSKANFNVFRHMQIMPLELTAMAVIAILPAMRAGNAFSRTITLAILTFLTGCVTPSVQNRQKYLTSHPNTEPSIRQAILDNRIMVGMTCDEVRASWGSPMEISGGGYGNSYEHWRYSGSWCYDQPSLMFENGKLINVNVNYTFMRGCPKEPFDIKKWG